MRSKAKIEAAAAAGADLLDHLVPDWAWKVDLSRVDMAQMHSYDGCGCIVMLVTGRDYEEALDTLGLWHQAPIYDYWSEEYDRRIDSRRRVAMPLGFENDAEEEDEISYWAWVEEVLDRRPTVLVGGEAA